LGFRRDNFRVAGYPSETQRIGGARMHWALAECIGDYALTETQQKLRFDCWKRAFLSGRDACC
jgi:predicted trehalose synthase